MKSSFWDRQGQRTGRHQQRLGDDPRANGFRLSERRNRHASAGAHQPVQCRRETPDQLRGGGTFRPRCPSRPRSRSTTKMCVRMSFAPAAPAGSTSIKRRARSPHAPTLGRGRAVSSRSAAQHKNRALAAKDVARPTGATRGRKREAEQAAKYQNQAKTGFGSQIRNYFLHRTSA